MKEMLLPNGGGPHVHLAGRVGICSFQVSSTEHIITLINLFFGACNGASVLAHTHVLSLTLLPSDANTFFIITVGWTAGLEKKSGVFSFVVTLFR